ncbi:MAG: trigger factor [Bacillota bacterium]|jgi:trigger factor
MKFELKKLDDNKMQVQVEVEEAQVADALQQSFKKVVKQVSVPGFRKGKVPRVIFEQRYGVEALYEDAIDILLPQAFEAALQENKLESIDRPEADVIAFEQGKPAVFQFIIQTPPEAELGQYLGLEVEQPSFPVTADDVEQQLQRLREQHSRLIDAADETVADQDFVTLDYQGFVDGEAFAGGQANDYSLQIGSNTFIPGFEQQLIGMTRGQSAEIEVTFPEQYHEESLAGKPATFQVTIKEIKRKEVPDLDDDFAAEVSEHETVEELRLDTQNKLEKAAALREKNAFENNVIEAVVANASVDIPQVMVNREVDEMIEELNYNLTRQGFPPEFAREYISGRVDAIRADYQDTAKDRVKTRLVLKKLTETLEVTVSDEDLEHKLQEMAELYQQDAAEIRSSLESRGQLEALRESIATEKTIEQLVASAKPVAPAEPTEVPTEEASEEVGE